MWARLTAFLRSILVRRRIEREVADELRFHLEQEIDANLARGLSPADARRVALAELGGMRQTAESVRDVRSTGLGRIAIDLRDAWRGLRTGRGTTVLAFAILALTMTAGTVTFSVVDAVAIRPLPYGAPDRLVSLWLPGSGTTGRYPPTPQDYFMWLEGARAFDSLGASRSGGTLVLERDGNRVETLTARRVTANLFDVLAVRPVAGRFFGPEHEQPGGPAGVILSHDAWVRRFGADETIVGRSLPFVDGAREVVGVLPEGVRFPVSVAAPADVYVPYVPTPADRALEGRRVGTILVVGRLRPGLTVAQGRADIQRISSALVTSLHEQVVGPARTWLLFVLAAVGFVLLVACANVANLLLGRARIRERELATREALGASRARIARVLTLEGLILSLAASAAGVAASVWGVELAAANLPPGLARVSEIGVDLRVLSVSVVAAVACGLGFASAPAWLAARSNLVDVIKASGGAIIGGRRRDRALGAGLIANVAFVTVLLVATTLVIGTFIVVTTSDLGFDRRNLMRVNFNRSLEDVADADRPAAAAAVRADVLERARSMPDVVGAAIVTNAATPMSGSSVRYSIVIPGLGETSRDDWLETLMITTDYFDLMGMRLIRGRTFGPADGAGAPLVMVINDVAAERFFPNRDPVGQVVEFRGPTTIIGVMRGVHFDGPESETRPEMYVPAVQELPRYQRDASTRGLLVVRTLRDPRAIAPAVVEAIRPALGGSEPTAPQFVGDDFRRVTAVRRFNAGVMAVFGVIAIAIGAVGVYGTMAFVVAQQVRAIGLHMALGASSSHVLRSVLWQALRRVAIGTSIGLAGAWAASSAFESMVFGVRPTEPLVYGGVAAWLACIGLAAALVPARRAARLDPLTVLRDQ